MSVKEIRELEEEINEISVEAPVEVQEDWEGRDVEAEEEEAEEEGFSIGDTSLARGKVQEHWGVKNLEEEIRGFDEGEYGGSFGGFEEDGEFGESDFSYDGGSGGGEFYGGSSGGGDFYGANAAGGNLYGAGKGGGDLYGVASKDGANLYNSGGGFAVYNVNAGGGKSNRHNMYQVQGSGKKKRRSAEKSGLVSSVSSSRTKRVRSTF